MNKLFRDWKTPFAIWVICLITFVLIGFTGNQNDPEHAKFVSSTIAIPIIIGSISFVIFFIASIKTSIKNIPIKKENSNITKPVSHNNLIITSFLLLLVVLGYLILQQSNPQLVNAILEKLQYGHPAKTSTTTPIPTEAFKYTLLSHDLKMGSSGDDVRVLQSAFTIRQYLPENLVTGYFGSATENAVKIFQKTNNLDPSGIVSGDTLKKFNEYFNDKTREYYLGLIKPVVYVPPATTNNNTTNASDPQVNCTINASCGGGTRLMTVNECNNSTCCEINRSWTVYSSMTECQNAQIRAHAGSTNINQGMTTTSTNTSNGKIKCSYSSGSYQFDFGELTYEECRVRSNEYWASKGQEISNSQPQNNTSITTSTNTKSQTQIDQCKDTVLNNGYANDMIMNQCSPYGGSTREACISIKQGERDQLMRQCEN